MVLCSPIFQGMCFEKKSDVSFRVLYVLYVCVGVCMYVCMYVPASRQLQLCSTSRVILEMTRGILE